MTKTKVLSIKISEEEAYMIDAVTNDMCLDNKSAAILSLVKKYYRDMRRNEKHEE